MDKKQRDEKQKEKEMEKEIGNEFSKLELIRLLNGTVRSHTKLMKFLYDKHRDVLREFEKTIGHGSLQIHFLGEDDEDKK